MGFWDKVREKGLEWQDERREAYEDAQRLSDKNLINRLRSSRGMKLAGYWDAAKERGLIRNKD